MKGVTSLHQLAFALCCTLLVVGCAKTPTQDALNPVAEAPVETAVAAETTSAPAPVAVVEQQPKAAAEMPVADLVRIHFDYDQFTLSPEAREILASNAAVLKGMTQLKVKIEGHCDRRGSDEYNLALGEQRAKAARAYLVSLGVAPERLETISFGEEQPLDPADTPEAWAKNRRDEFKVLP